MLCVLALFVAQTFGSKVAYYCLCGGKPVPTLTAYCYGPHGEECAEEEAKAGDAPCEDNEGGDRKDHQVVSQEVPMRAMDAKAQVFAPQVLLAVLRVVDFVYADREVKAPTGYLTRFGESPPFGVTVARTIVLRI